MARPRRSSSAARREAASNTPRFAAMTVTRAPCGASSAARACIGASWRATRTRSWPSRANSRARSAPIPPEAPVIKASGRGAFSEGIEIMRGRTVPAEMEHRAAPCISLSSFWSRPSQKSCPEKWADGLHPSRRSAEERAAPGTSQKRIFSTNCRMCSRAGSSRVVTTTSSLLKRGNVATRRTLRRRA